jgi:hypothetical protein
MYEIDQLLFMEYEIPKFEVNPVKRKSTVARLPPDTKKQMEREEDWNSLERLS